MLNVIKDVINSGNFELSNMLGKINTVWIEGKLNDDERTELVEMAQGKANSKNSMDLYLKVLELDMRVKVLEEKIANMENNDTSNDVTYADFEVGKWYYNGDYIAFDGKNYKCIAPDGVVCVWSPTEYPTYWELVE